MCSILGGEEVVRSASCLLPPATGPVHVDGSAGGALDVHRDVGGVVVDRSDAPVGDQLVGPGDGARDQEHGTKSRPIRRRIRVAGMTATAPFLPYSWHGT